MENPPKIPLRFLSTEEMSELSSGSHSERALPEIVLLGPAKLSFPGWMGRLRALLLNSKGSDVSCQR